jgi:hypothetical protein
MTEASPILPRELTEGLSDEVRNIPPPPTPILPEPYALRLVDPDGDAAMIAEWMKMPHLVEAWESAWPASRWRQYLRAQLDGDYSRPLVGSLHGQAGGYFEVYRAARDSIATRWVLVDCCCRMLSPVSSKPNPVVAESCSTLTIAIPRRAGCANSPAAHSSVSTT